MVLTGSHRPLPPPGAHGWPRGPVLAGESEPGDGAGIRGLLPWMGPRSGPSGLCGGRGRQEPKKADPQRGSMLGFGSTSLDLSRFPVHSYVALTHDLTSEPVSPLKKWAPQRAAMSQRRVTKGTGLSPRWCCLAPEGPQRQEQCFSRWVMCCPQGANGRLQAVPHLIQPGIPFSRVLPHPQAQWFSGC